MPENFNQWINRLLDDNVLSIGELYNKFLGDIRNPSVHFIGRFENLVEDLITGLRLAGEEFDERDVRNTPPANTSKPGLKAIAKYDLRTLARLIQTHRHVFDVFGYSKDIRSYEQLLW